MKQIALMVPMVAVLSVGLCRCDVSVPQQVADTQAFEDAGYQDTNGTDNDTGGEDRCIFVNVDFPCRKTMECTSDSTYNKSRTRPCSEDYPADCCSGASCESLGSFDCPTGTICIPSGSSNADDSCQVTDIDGGVVKDSGLGGDAEVDGGQIEGDAGQDAGVVESVWADSSSGLTWQNPATYDEFTYDKATEYCNGLSWTGYDGWRLPTISELRSLIRGCLDTQTGGACGVTDSCLEQSCEGQGCSGCGYLQGPGEGACYWDAALRGPCALYWSSSSYTDDTAYTWVVFYSLGLVNYYGKTKTSNVRCVRGP